MKLLASKTGQSSRKISISRYTEWKKAKATGRLIILEELESEPSRNDAGLAAAELALAVEKHELDSRSMDTVGAVDTRDIDEKQRNSVIDKIHKSAVSISSRCGIKLLEFRIVNQDPPALSNELIINTAESASQVLKLSYKKMISRAYHDSLFMARVSLPWA